MTAPASVAKAPSVPGRIAVAVTPVRTKRGKDKRSVKSPSPSRSSSPSSSRGRKVEFGWQSALVIWQSSTMSRQI